MSAADLIASLDEALATGPSEDVILRRRIGEPPNAAYVSVTCRARVDRIDNIQQPAGIRISEFTLIMSPTQINDAKWPGGTIPVPPPFDLDPRIPRENDTDEILMRGHNPRVIAVCDPKMEGREPVRFNLRVVA